MEKGVSFLCFVLLFIGLSKTASWELDAPQMSSREVQDALSNPFHERSVEQQQGPAFTKCLVSLGPRHYDATGRLPSGILMGNMDAQGQFDECYESEGYYTMVFGLFRIVSLASVAGGGVLPAIPVALRWGVCLPKGCDVPKFVQGGGLQIMSATVSGGAYYFDSVASLKVTMPDDEPLSEGSIAFLAVIGFLLSMVLIGSTYDWLSRNWGYYFGSGEEDGHSTEALPLMSNADEDAEKGKFLEIGEESLGGLQKGERNEGDDDVMEYQRSWQQIAKDIGVGILLAFSIFKTFADFTKVKIHPQTACLDGFRVFAILWVVIGHTYIFLMYIGVTNLLDIGSLRGRFLFQFVSNGTFSVDVFFVMSGFLMSLLMLKSLVKTGGKMQWGLVFFHRWWRLSPLYYLTVFYGATLFFYMVVGPFAQVIDLSKPCQEEWYWNILYLNNFLPEGGNLCLPWVWYLALDMQFFFLCVPIIYCLYRWPHIGFGVVGVLSLASYIATIMICVNKGYTIDDFLLKLDLVGSGTPGSDEASDGSSTGSEDPNNYGEDIYDAPWARVHPYFIGIMAGYVAFVHQKTFVMKLWQQLLSFLISFFLVTCPIYISYWTFEEDGGEGWSEAGSVLYITFARTVFGLGMAGLILLCYSGNGGFMNWFFSWPIFNVLAKLTYACYMIHLIVMYIYFYSFQYLPYLSDGNAVMMFFSVSVMTFVIALGAHLVIELPFASLERVLLGAGK